jgi:glucose/arabinose dehydrogenase
MLMQRSGVLAASFLLLFATGAAAQRGPQCAADNAGLTLPKGFCAVVVADGLGAARHLTVAPNGDVFVAIAGRQDAPGGVIALRDTTGDGVADVRAHFGGGTGDDVKFFGDHLYYTTNDAILRYPWKAGALEPAGPADTVVRDLPVGGHRAKEIVITAGGVMYVNIGSPSNSCQVQDRSLGSPGKNPCPELATRAGIWRFDPERTGQTEADGARFATGMRNSVALALRPQDRKLYAVIHGRDQLFQNWSKIGYDSVAGAEKPAEKFVRVEAGDDYGWPYCYYDPQLDHYVLSPEYGGDGKQAGRCAGVKAPLVAFPAHWAPLGLLFYSGTALPAHYAGGAFIAFHGSWNRAPMPQAGYKVVFVPFAGDAPAGKWEVFADGFAGSHMDPREAAHRPVGLAEGPDGSLYVSDDQGGRIYRIVYRSGGGGGAP